MAPKAKNKGRFKPKNKRKKVLLDNGLQVSKKVLTPVNSLGVSTSGSTRNLFYDGSKMEPILIGKNLGNVQFQTVGPKLNGEKNLAVSFSPSNGATKVGKLLLNSQKGDCIGASSRLKPPEGTGIVVDENSRQSPFHMTETFEHSLPVKEAVDEILHGLHDGKRRSSKIGESGIDKVDSDDESLDEVSDA